MNKEEFFINAVYLKGTLANVYKGNKGCVIITINTGDNNYPQVVCWQKNAKTIWENYFIGNKICIRANLQSSKRPNGKIQVSLFCNEILDNATFTEEYYNSFIVRGQTVSTSLGKNIMRLLLKTYTEHLSTFYITIYNADARIHSFEEGQPVKIIGNVQTVKKQNSRGEYIFYTNFVATQISDY